MPPKARSETAPPPPAVPVPARDEGDLPEGWAVASLDELRHVAAPIIYGILQPGPDVDGGVRYVRPTEIVDDKIQISLLRHTSPEIARRYQRATLTTDDVILTIVGSIGKVALVPSELDGANLTQSSARIRANQSLLNPMLLFFGLNSTYLFASTNRSNLVPQFHG